MTPTRTEQKVVDTPASVNVVTSEDIRTSPALVADDVLRNVPTFSLFRRTSSLVAQPTTQGVSLRGIGPSGQSRTLVLLDGIPFNDPFGGWVYWTRVPLESVDRVLHYHFELLNLGYAAYAVLYGLCRDSFPDMPDRTIAGMVGGGELLPLRPEEELKRLAELALEL